MGQSIAANIIEINTIIGINTRAFSYASQSASNSLSEHLRHLICHLTALGTRVKDNGDVKDIFVHIDRHMQRIRDFLVIVAHTSLLFTFT